MQAWLGRTPQNGNSQSRYSLTEFGMDEATLRGRFSAYMDAFGVAREWDQSRTAQQLTA